jgi:L-iditol 2-dehydrogenase
MKALNLKAYNHFELIDTAMPAIGAEDVRIRVKAVGICGSDVHGMDGSTGRRIPPITMGHEAAGVIQEVGAGVTDWQVGDRVTMDSTVYCGNCGFCAKGQINLCDNRQVLGVSCEDYRRHGAFAEYVAVPARILYRLPDDLAFEHAAMVEPVSIALHAFYRSGWQAGESAMVIGAGMIGLLMIQVLAAKGCDNLIAVDIDPAKLRLARELGATSAFDAREDDVVANVLSATGGKGAHHAFEVVGATSPIQTAIDGVGKGGVVTLIGNVSPEVSVHLQKIVTKELDLRGSCASAGEYPECLDLINQGAINMAAFISSEAPLVEGADWFQRLYNKEDGLLKVILKP